MVVTHAHIKTASAASLASLAGIGSSLADTAPAASNKAKPDRSKRDRMQEVLDMAGPSKFIPAAFFMHFGVKGDAAVKAHLDYFHGTGMDFVKIQFDEQQLQLPPDVKIESPGDWAKIPILPEKWFEPSLYLLKRLIKEAKSEALIIQTFGRLWAGSTGMAW
jgi:uroporphyrinogen decarboxylase